MRQFFILFRQAGSNEKILLETFNAELEQVTPLGLRNFRTKEALSLDLRVQVIIQEITR